MGNRDDIEEMTGSSATVLTNVLKLIDKYDLYGKVAYPKHHKQSDVPHIYCLAAKTKVSDCYNLKFGCASGTEKKEHLTQLARFFYLQGVFINPALVEPFGLTLIEVSVRLY